MKPIARRRLAKRAKAFYDFYSDGSCRKQCSKCRKFKDLCEFYKSEKYYDGYLSQCKKCHVNLPKKVQAIVDGLKTWSNIEGLRVKTKTTGPLVKKTITKLARQNKIKKHKSHYILKESF